MAPDSFLFPFARVVSKIKTRPTMTSLGLKHWTLIGMYKVKYSSMIDQFRTSRGGFQTTSLAPSYDDVVKTYMCISAAPKCH